MISKKGKIILGTVLVVAIVLTSPSLTWGKEKPRVIAIENSYGLEVRVPKKTVDLGNLNPGDSKEMSLQVSNTGSNDITVYIRTNVLEQKTLNGGYLADIMNFTMKEKSNIMTDGSFRDAGDRGNILIGKMKAGESKTLDFSSNLPGEGTGNEYQGAYMRVSWTFVTQHSSIGGVGSGGGGNPEREIPKEIITIDDESIPLGSEDPLDEETITIEDNLIPLGPEDPMVPSDSETTIGEDKIPFGLFKLPQTGQLAFSYFYGIGAFLITLGLYSKKRS